ncbi:MAG: heavy metal translocating P-type ATPase [Planctomycetota bacterium]
MPSPAETAPPQRVRDPVCGMTVDPDRTPHVLALEGVRHAFCSAGCLRKYREHPEAYGAKPPAAHLAPADVRPSAREAPTAGGAAATFTCPMHPEVRQIGPGSCPLCGMSLEPLMPAAASAGADDAQDPELRDLTRRLIGAALLTAPLFVMAMGSMLPALEERRHAAPRVWSAVEAVLATPVVFWAGWPFLVRGAKSLLPLAAPRLNMFTLISIGVLAAWALSVAAVVAPGLFPAAFSGHAGAVPVYFEAAAVIVTLVLAGQVLEVRARRATGGAIRALLDLAPRTARRLRPDGSEEDVALAAVAIGDPLRVRPGESIPVDGVVTAGQGVVDMSMVTGESVPIEVQTGSAVVGGTANRDGSFLMRAEKVGAETLLSRIIAQVAQAQRSRAPIQRLADRVSAIFVPLVLLSAAITFGAWLWAGPEPRLAHAVVNAVAVLIIACPCALGLATPVSIMVAMGRGARLGILFRDAEAIERLREVDTLVVDKTGTLTEGRPALVAVEVLEGAEGARIGEDELLSLVAGLERGSEHPIASAIVRGAQERGLRIPSADDFQAVAGHGAVGSVSGRQVAAGNAALLARLHVESAPLLQHAEELRREGRTAILVAIDGRAAGWLAVADPVKTTAAEALRRLRAEGLHLVMLTGDAPTTAQAVARQLGIEDVQAGVLPEDKLARIRALQAAGRKVAMAGDGVNDAPALAQADVGIAMGTGTDAAIESSAVTLLRGDLLGIGRALRLSHATVRNIRQNLVFAFLYNALGVPLAAGVLYPATGLLLSPMIAAAAMSLSSVSVLANALRLRRATE